MLSIDRAQKLLYRLGWSAGDLCCRDAAGDVWMVYAHRDDQRVLVRALGQTGAWNEALRQAGIVQRDQK